MAGAAPGDDRPLRVSVILATRNRADRLDAAVASVLSQDLDALELVVVDDGSGDATPERLSAWAARDARVRLLRNETNLGLPAALNRGVDAARAPFLARIDDDDRWTDTGKLSAQLAWMDAHPDGVLVGTAYVDEWGRTTSNPLEDAAIRDQMLARCPFCHPTVLMRAEAVAAAGGYDESLPYAEDWDLWLRLGLQGRMGNLPAVTLEKSRGGDTLSERWFRPQLAMAGDFARRYAGDYPGAFRARALHAFSRVFFRLAPVDGALHRALGRAFRGVFGLGRGG